MLRFVDDEAERTFNRSWVRGTSGITRIWAIAGLLFYVAYTILVVTTVPPAAQGPVWVRIFIVLPVLILAQAPVFWAVQAVAERKRSPVGRISSILAVSYLTSSIVAYCGALLMFATTAAPFNQIYLYETGIIFIFCQHYFRIRFYLVATFTAVTSGAATTTFLLMPGLFEGPTAAIVMTTLAFAAVGVFSAYTREIFARRNFASIKTLQEEKARSERIAEEARDASVSKSRFLAMMSHELRTPLNAIIGFSDAMQQGVFGQVEQVRYREYLFDINRSGGQLLYLVNQILDLTRAEEQQVEMHDEANNLGELISGVMRNFALPMEEAGINLSVENRAPGDSLLADQRMLRQMLDNVVSNALKFTGRGGRVAVTVDRDDAGLSIAVADSGIGMTEDDADRALSLFGQVDSDLNRTYNGAGIGLPLTRKLVELHEGRLELNSVPGRGTTVILHFPHDRVVADAPVAEAADNLFAPVLPRGRSGNSRKVTALRPVAVT